jgi:hypothetical protein
MAPPFLRFQTKKLGIWVIWKAQESGEKSGSILQLKDSFNSDGTRDSKMVLMDLYPNQWDLVNDE